MRSETRGAVLAFLRNPTMDTFSAVEPFEDEVVTHFSTIASAGDQLDDEMLEAFTVCVLSTPANEEVEMLIGEFMRRFCDFELLAPDPDRIRALLGYEVEVHEQDLFDVRDRGVPPPVPVFDQRLN